jgi:hypothetical protein
MQLEIGILQDICDQIANEIDASSQSSAVVVGSSLLPNERASATFMRTPQKSWSARSTRSV